MFTEEEKRDLKAQQSSTRGQGFKTQPKAKKSNAQGVNTYDQTAITAHNQYEQVATGLVQHGNDRLGTLVSAITANRQVTANQFVDFLEDVEAGNLDAYLITQEYQKRMANRQAEQAELVEFNVGAALTVDIPKVDPAALPTFGNRRLLK